MKKINIIFILIICLLMLTACNKNTSMKMITLDDAFSITPYINIYGSEKDINKYQNKIYTDLSKILKDLDDKYNVNKENSLISSINKNAYKDYVEIDDECVNIINTAIRISSDVSDKYDISIYPLSKLWDFKNKYYTNNNYNNPPRGEDINEILSLIDYQNIEIKDHKIRFKVEGMEIDLGSIVKGYACDLIASVMEEEYNMFSYIINIGGNIYAKGEKKKNTGFSVGIQTPFFNDRIKDYDDADLRKEGYYLGYIESNLEGTTVVTSGIYERYIKTSDGIMYHHILDKYTGYPIDNDIESVSIVIDGNNKSIEADGLSTALLCMGKTDALKYANEHGLKIIIATKNKEVIVSDNIKDEFVFNEIIEKMGYAYNNK